MGIIVGVFHVLLYIWLIFFGGAEKLEGSFSTIFFFYPGMSVRELKFYASLSLALIPVYAYML